MRSPNGAVRPAPNLRSGEKFQTPNSPAVAVAWIRLPPVVPGVVADPTVLAPRKVTVGKMPSSVPSISVWFSRTMPAGFDQTVAASYAFDASPANAFAIQSALPSRRA